MSYIYEMKFKAFILFVGLVLLQSTIQAQTDSVVLQDRYYRHNYDNDFFVATDRYYTQGVYLEFIFPAFKKLLISHALIPLRPKNSITGSRIINYYGVSTERQGFTPTSIRHFGKPESGERPYAAVVYLTHSLVSIDPARKLRLTSRLNLGLMGPNLFGEEEQVAIHTQLGNILPLGWEYQIENDYVLNYDVYLEKGIVDNKCFTVTGFTELRAGTLYDDVALGAMMRIGYMQKYFNNLGITRQKQAQKFQCYLFFKGKIKAVAYNASMQGGLINQNSTYAISDSDVERLVGIGYYGVVVAYKRLSLEYSFASITKEYKKGKNHAWGRIGINVCF